MKDSPVQFETLENGDLKITATKEYRDALADMVLWFSENLALKMCVESFIMEKLVESYGQFNPEGNELRYYESNDDLFRAWGLSVGLTSCPVLIEDRLKGEYEWEFDEKSRMWGFMNYALDLEIEALIRDGEITFTYAGTDEEQHGE